MRDQCEGGSPSALCPERTALAPVVAAQRSCMGCGQSPSRLLGERLRTHSSR